MKKSKIETIIILLLVIGGIVFGYYKYVFHDQLVRIIEMKKEVKNSETNLLKLREIMQDKNGTMQKIAKYENEASALDKAIPQGTSNYDFILQLYNTVKSYGLTSKNLEPQKASSDKGYISQTVNILVSGKKNSILNFIKYLQDNPRRIQIKEFSIKEINVDEADATLKINIFSVNN